MSRFTADSSVRRVLAEQPKLAELLAAFHPPLTLLRYAKLRRLLPSTLTLAGLARLTGTKTGALVAVCNLPGVTAHTVDATQPRDTPQPTRTQPPWPEGTAVTELDLRPAMKAGAEPFADIMSAWRRTPSGTVLCLRTPFKPTPLIELMSRQGATVHVSWSGDDCLCSLWRAPKLPPGAQGMAQDDQEELAALLAQRRHHRDGATVLDLHQLEPPLPLELTLLALADDTLFDPKLDPAQPPTRPVLVLRLPHEPHPLYPLLRERGLDWEVEPDPEGEGVRIGIRPSGP